MLNSPPHPTQCQDSALFQDDTDNKKSTVTVTASTSFLLCLSQLLKALQTASTKAWREPTCSLIITQDVIPQSSCSSGEAVVPFSFPLRRGKSSPEKSPLRMQQSKSSWDSKPLHAQGTCQPTTPGQPNLGWGNCDKPRMWDSAAEQHRRREAEQGTEPDKVGFASLCSLAVGLWPMRLLKPRVLIFPLSCSSRLGFHTNKRKFLRYFKFKYKGQKMGMGEKP